MTRRLTFAAGGVVAALLLATLAYSQLRERRFNGVVLTPDRASLATGGTQQFRAYGVLSNGDTVAVKTRYRVTGGEITAGGLYTAGPVPGTYDVIATLYDDDYERLDFDSDDDVEGAEDDEDEVRLAATATVTVTGAGPSASPPPE